MTVPAGAITKDGACLYFEDGVPIAAKKVKDSELDKFMGLVSHQDARIFASDAWAQRESLQVMDGSRSSVWRQSLRIGRSMALAPRRGASTTSCLWARRSSRITKTLCGDASSSETLGECNGIGKPRTS